MKRLNELYDIDNDMKIYSIHSDSRYVKPPQACQSTNSSTAANQRF